jgi:PAS domain S-box-containing protein
VRENEERLRMAMEVAQIAAWEWHLATGHMTWSTDPEELFGFPKGAFGEDLRIFHALHPNDRERMETTLAEALRSGDYHGEFRALGDDGRVVWITERGRVIYDADGVAERMVGVSRDVTADREAERERDSLLRSAREARDEAERQMRFKDEFLAVLSHELRTPMNAVLGWLSILLSGKPVRDPKATLAIIQRNAQVQAKLIDDLLDMTRLMSGNIHLDLGTLDPAELVQATIHDLQPAAEAKGVRLSASIEDPVAPITGDGRRLQQVLWNLVHNAIKFTPQGGRVVLGVRTADGHVSFTVHDTGRGISPDFLPYVFERFRQADPSTTREAFGLGLGLSIAKHLVELHGGTIAAVSEGDGRGAVFTVRVPRAAQVPTGLLPAHAPPQAISPDWLT